MFGQYSNDGLVGLPVDSPLAHVDGHGAVRRGLDQRPFAAGGLHPDDEILGHNVSSLVSVRVVPKYSGVS